MDNPPPPTDPPPPGREEADDQPAFGPPGYLPERAARRARKIVLRAPLGLQWIIAAGVVGIVVLAAGVVFLTRAGRPPGPPFTRVGPADTLVSGRQDTGVVSDVSDGVTRGTYDPRRQVLYLRAGGRIRAFAIPDRLADAASPAAGGGRLPVWCPSSRHLEAAGGQVWSPTGRALNGGRSLVSYPVVVVDGIVYANFTQPPPAPAPTDVGTRPACFSPSDRVPLTRPPPTGG